MADPIKATDHEGWLVVTAVRHGWLVLRSTSTHNSPAPDLVWCRPPELLVVKARTDVTARKPLSDGQQAWLDAAAHVPGVESFVWAPADQDEAWERLTREAPAGA